jgi:hypothetical protein
MAAAPGMDQGRLHGVNVYPPALLCQGGMKLTMTSRSISRAPGRMMNLANQSFHWAPDTTEYGAPNHNRYVVSDYLTGNR